MGEIVASALVWIGIVTGMAGVASLVRPMRFLRIVSRKRGAQVAAAGAALFLVAAHWPAGHYNVTTLRTKLDVWMPSWQFREFHSKRVRGTPQQVSAAVREVTADEIFLFRTLTWIRNPRFGSGGTENILNPPHKKPILEVAQAGGFVPLADDGPQEIVLGTVVVPDRIPTARDKDGFLARRNRPGNALAAMNFTVRDDGDGWCTVSTETRVLANDPRTQRAFARYWRVIYPGSSLMRFTWLRAIARRVENAPAP